MLGEALAGGERIPSGYLCLCPIRASVRPPARPLVDICGTCLARVAAAADPFQVVPLGRQEGRRCTPPPTIISSSLARRCNCDVRRWQFTEQFVLLLEGGEISQHPRHFCNYTALLGPILIKCSKMHFFSPVRQPFREINIVLADSHS